VAYRRITSDRVICVDCKTLILGARWNRKRCDECRRLYRAARFSVRFLLPGEPIPDAPFRRAQSGHGYVRRIYRLDVGLYVQCYEHRAILGASHGEEVHHENGLKTDNRPANLQVLDGRDHRMLHRTVDRAQVCALYREGLSAQAVGLAVGCNPRTVLNILHASGESVRPARRYSTAAA
jgi:hypothetical protein